MCPELGPLDYINTDGDIEWNHGSPQNYEGIYNKTASAWTDKVDRAMVIDLSEPDDVYDDEPEKPDDKSIVSKKGR